MGRELHRIVGEFDDVDLFAAQFADDRLHAHALHADAGADAVHVAVAAGNGDLGALAGFARAAADGHGAVVNLRNFLFEQALHQFGIGARNHHARAFRRLVDDLDHAANAVAHAVAFEARLLALGQAGFGLAEIDHQIETFDALDGGVDQFAHAVGIFAVNGFALGFADLLKDDLLGGLRGDAAQRVGRLRQSAPRDPISACRVDPLRFGERHFERGIGHRSRPRFSRHRASARRIVVEIGFIVLDGAEMFARRDQHGVLDGIENDLGVDALFFAENFNRLINAVHDDLPRSCLDKSEYG